MAVHENGRAQNVVCNEMPGCNGLLLLLPGERTRLSSEARKGK
jgi:hypothetical protein